LINNNEERGIYKVYYVNANSNGETRNKEADFYYVSDYNDVNKDNNDAKQKLSMTCHQQTMRNQRLLMKLKIDAKSHQSTKKRRARLSWLAMMATMTLHTVMAMPAPT